MAEDDTKQPSQATFDDYSWDQDEEWQVLIKKLEFPGSFDEAKKQKHILKRKQKYFKEKIDPNFVPTIGNKPKKQPQPQPPQPDNEENPHDPTTKNKSKSETPQYINDENNNTSSSSTSSS
eukprot:420864_1